MQSGLCALQEWSDKWLLKLHASKYKSVYYGRNINHDYARYLNSTKLENVNVIKDFGVIFDPDLSLVLHCKEKINKACAMLRIIRRNCMYLSEEAFVLLYNAHVRSQLEYANSVWNP